MDSKGGLMRTTFKFVEMDSRDFEAQLNLWADTYQVEVVSLTSEKVKPTRKSDPEKTIVTALIKRTEG